MKIEIIHVSFSPSSDFLQRETDNIIIVHVWETLFYILNLQIYVYKLWERDNHENWSRTCRALVSPSPLLFFRFSPDSIDKSILSGLVACAELCKIFLLVCRCCKIAFPFSGVMMPRSHTMKERARKGPSLPWGMHARRNAKSSGIHESQVLPWCGADHVYVMSMHGISWNTSISMRKKCRA